MSPIEKAIDRAKTSLRDGDTFEYVLWHELKVEFEFIDENNYWTPTPIQGTGWEKVNMICRAPTFAGSAVMTAGYRKENVFMQPYDGIRSKCWLIEDLPKSEDNGEGCSYFD